MTKLFHPIVICEKSGLLTYPAWPDGHGVDAGTSDSMPELLEAVSQNNSHHHQPVKQP
jgi:hypothetical protein